MKVGLDANTLSSLKLSPTELLREVMRSGLEGLHLPARPLLGLGEAGVREFADLARSNGLYLELAGPLANPASTGQTERELLAEWRPLFALSAGIGSPILNTCFGLIKERTFASPTLAEQLRTTASVLKELAQMGEDSGVTVTVELHVDLTSGELVELIESVGSPFVRANLDTANALGLMEDPVEAARALLPYVRTTHYKDTCIYPTEDGYNWMGGCPLGRGLVDLPMITDMLYEADPGINLNIEDCGGFMTIPLYDEGFVRSFGDLTGERMVRFFRLLLRGQAMVRSGAHPDAHESRRTNWGETIPARLAYNAEYAKRLRDETVARHRRGA